MSPVCVYVCVCVCVCVRVSHSVSASFQPSESLMEMNAASSTLQHWFNHTNRQSNLPLCVCVCVCVCVCNPVSSFRSDHKVQSFREHPEACAWNSTQVRATVRFYVCVCQSVRVCLPMLIRASSSQGRTTWEKSALRTFLGAIFGSDWGV